MSQDVRRSRILYLLEVLRKETDEDHGLTMGEILDYLNEDGITAERKVIYRDIDSLREFGYDVVMTRDNPARYRLVNKDFSEDDLLLLVDVVRSSRFLTQRKSESLVRAVKMLGSRYETMHVGKSLRVSGRIRNQNQSAFSNVNVIQKAISSKRKIEFRYFDHKPGGGVEYRNGGGRYSDTPVQIFYSDGNYYLLAYSDEKERMSTYRVDRMDRVMISPESAARNELIKEFDPIEYEQRIFGMYQGESKMVTLVSESSLMNNVVDRFGSDANVKLLEDGRIRVVVKVQESNVFFSWITQFRGRMSIVSPKSSVEAYKAFLNDLVGE